MNAMRWCITQRRSTYQAGVVMPLWPITRVRSIGPVFSSYEAANAYLQSIKPRAS